MDAIAIDGPAASGKTAIGAELAQRLGYRFVDTGAMYRAVTWRILRRSIDPSDEDAVADVASNMRIAVAEPSPGSHGTTVLVDGEDATPHLRDSDVERAVSLVSRIPLVRKALVRIQQELAQPGRIVMAGRDIGTVVLPRARLKVYLDASREVRAQRRADQMQAAGIEPDFDALIADLERRDGIDSTREASPLTAAPEAVIINTDNLTIEEVVSRLIELAQE
jgi:cytidylate kinase